MRKLNTFLLVVLSLFLAVPAGAAFAAPLEKEEVAYQQVTSAYFEVWKHIDGHWQDNTHDGKPEKPGERVAASAAYQVPKSIKDRYHLTRVEVIYDFGEPEYQAAGGRLGETWEQYRTITYSHRAIPAGPLKASQDQIRDGKTTVTWDVVLDMAEHGIHAYNMKNAATREMFNVGTGQFADAAEGYRYMLPAIIKWYGVPKSETPLPNLKVKSIDPGTGQSFNRPVAMTEGTLTALAGEPGTEKVYQAEAGKTYTATVTFAIDPISQEVLDQTFLNYGTIEELLAEQEVPAPAALIIEKEDARQRVDLAHKDGPGRIVKTRDLWTPNGYKGDLNLVSFLQAGAEVKATASWTAQPDMKSLAAVINWFYPMDDPEPYVMPLYMEALPSGQDSAIFDNVLVVPIEVTAPPKPEPEPEPEPKMMDLEALINFDGIKLDMAPGEKQTLTGVILNKGDEKVTTTVVWRARDKVQKTEKVTIPAGGKVNTSFNFTMPNVPLNTEVMIELEVNPNRNQPPNEVRWWENMADVPIYCYFEEESDGGLAPGWFTK